MDGIEHVAAALRRSAWIVVAAALAGIAGMTALAQLAPPRYEAVAQVLQSDDDASSVLGVGAPVDSQRAGATGVLLAQTGAFYREVASELPASATGGAGIRGEFVFEQAPGTDLLIVTGIADDSERARTIANTAAEEYVRFRAEALAASLREGRRGVEQQLGSQQEEPQLRDGLSRLQILEALAGRGATVVDTAERVEQTRPRPLRDALLGLSTGLIVALLIIAGREAVGTRRRALEALRRRTGANVAVTVALNHGSRSGERLATALAPARSSGEAALVIVSSLDGPGTVRPMIEALAGALSDRGDRVLIPGDREDGPREWTPAPAAHASRRGGERHWTQLATLARPEAPPSIGGGHEAPDWILVEDGAVPPTAAHAQVFVVHLDAVPGAGSEARVRQLMKADVHRVLVALSD